MHRSFYTAAGKSLIKRVLCLSLCREDKGGLFPIKKTALLLFLWLVAAGVAAKSSHFYFDIPRQTADGALTAFGQQADVTVLYRYDVVSAYTSTALKGKYTIETAIGILLKGTDLNGELRADNHLIITQGRKIENGEEMMNTKKNILASTIAVFMVSGAGGVLVAEGAEQVSTLDEIIVTATKRETSLQDTAISISAIGGDEIDKRNLVGMEDYLPYIAGVSMQDRGAGQNDIVIRGTSIGSQTQLNPATGIYFGETPVTGLSTSTLGNTAGSADIKMVDIERVEVLRGPQGTLYGAGSMGGTVRVIPNKPVLSEFEGKVAARYSQTGEKGGDNTMMQGIVNLPIIDDELAVRAAVYQFDNDGYIDNIAGSQSGSGVVAERITQGGVGVDRKVGGDKYTGARLSALWQPIEAFSATLSYLNQEIEQDGFTEVNANLSGGFQQVRMAVDGAKGEFVNNETELFNLVLEYDLGWGTLFSSTSDTDYVSTSGLGASLFPFSVAPESSLGVREVDSLVEELRFVSDFEGRLQILLGYYYEDKDDLIDSNIDYRGTLPVRPAEANPQSHVASILVSKQKSIFGELSYDINDQLTATLGFRSFDYDLSRPFSETNGVARVDQGQSGRADDVNYKINLSYKANDDTLIYALWAEGFRMGGFQSLIVPERDDPDGDGVLDFVDGVSRRIEPGRLLDPDTTESVELGLKTSLMDNKIRLNAAIFRTDWKGLPLGIRVVGGPTMFFNIGKSTVEGIELEVQTQLSESLMVNLSTSYIEAVLAEDAIFLGGEKGESLPGSADFNLSLGVEYQFNAAGYDSYIRADYGYVDEFEHVFKSRLQVGESVAGGYSTVDLKMGSQLDDISFDLFVKNLTNSDKFTWVDSAWSRFGSGRGFRQKPRTVGLNVSYHF